MATTEVTLGNYPDLGERTYAIVKEEIITCKLASGTRLPIAELASRLEISTTPVKDALARLVADGLVHELPRRGYVVSDIDPRTIAYTIDARLLLELAACDRGAVAATVDQVQKIRQLVVSMESLLDERLQYRDYAQFSGKDSELHACIILLSGNPLLGEMYTRLNTRLLITRTHFAVRAGSVRGAPTLQEHRAILQALEARDLPALKKALTFHAREACKFFSGIDI